MGRVLTFSAPRTVDFEVEEDRALAPTEVRLETMFSGISAGTELTAYRGSNPYLHKRWNPERKLFEPAAESSLAFPLRGWGYEEMGRVVEAGPAVGSLAVGDLVYGTWGHRSHHVADESVAGPRKLPDGLEPVLGIFSHIGPIALNGILDAGIRLGETAAVFGLGVPGQIAAQMAKRSGARVIGVDMIPSRLALAQELGAVDEAINAADGSVAEQIKELTGGRGADVALEVTGSAAALHEATRCAAYSAKVVSLGFIQGGANSLFLGEEFHHNRINIVCSQIGGVAPEMSYRWDRLRLVHTFMALQASGALNLKPLISHTFPFGQGAEAFQLLDEKPEAALQVVLDFTG